MKTTESQLEELIKKEDFIPCGNGDNVCNCKSADECGYVADLPIKPAVKPPLGIMPKELHDQMRFEEVNAAIKRYYDAGLEIPIEWVKERNDYLKK